MRLSAGQDVDIPPFLIGAQEILSVGLSIDITFMKDELTLFAGLALDLPFIRYKMTLSVGLAADIPLIEDQMTI